MTNILSLRIIIQVKKLSYILECTRVNPPPPQVALQCDQSDHSFISQSCGSADPAWRVLDHENGVSPVVAL